jgi:hypothetical protein
MPTGRSVTVIVNPLVWATDAGAALAANTTITRSSSQGKGPP